jgi:hypothetical protein
MATTTTTVWDLHKNFATVGRQWVALFALCDDAALFRARAETISAWGVDKQVHHVGIAMNGIGQGIEKMLANPQQGAGLGPTHPFAMPMLESGTIPRGVGKAPETLHPPDAPMREQTRALIQSAKTCWDALANKGAQLEQTPATHPHFALGNFTSVQWVRFMAVHTAHHFKIIHEILDATGHKVPFDKTVEDVN